MSIYRESQTPSVPNRSPFRIRDSQIAKVQQSHVDRWSFSMELSNMWNMKPIILETYNIKQNQSDMFSSGNLLTQLLVSQAILDSNDYKILSFEKLENLKREYLELHEHIKNLSKSIELENRIKNISKSLENINLKNSRNSVIYLQKQRQSNDNKISQLTLQVEQLKLKEINMKKIILQHTAAVLNKGIQKLESSTSTPFSTATSTPNQYQFNDKIILFESELDHITRRVDHLYKKYCSASSSSPKKPLDKLRALDQHLSRIKAPSITKRSSNNSPADQRNKSTLLAIKHEKNHLLSKLVDMELKSTKLLEQMTNYSNKQKAIKFEMLQFKGEAIELQLWDKIRQRDEDAKKMNDGQNDISVRPQTNAKDQNHKKQLQDQAKIYEQNISRQNQELEKTTQNLDQLEINCNKLKNQKLNLDNLVKSKTREIDEQDNQISRLNEEIRNQARAMTPKNEIYRPENKAEKERLKKVFEEKETRWTEHTHSMEDSFDELLENFDKLTNTAIEFDSSRMRYERTIDKLNKDIHQLENELIDEKVKKIGYNNNQGEAPTTVALRKEFRTLVAEIKKTHQSRMDREGEEIRKLQLQLEELQDSNNNKSTVKQYSMSVQTDF